jgi:hypothetical protein
MIFLSSWFFLATLPFRSVSYSGPLKVDFSLNAVYRLRYSLLRLLRVWGEGRFRFQGLAPSAIFPPCSSAHWARPWYRGPGAFSLYHGFMSAASGYCSNGVHVVCCHCWSSFKFWLLLRVWLCGLLQELIPVLLLSHRIKDSRIHGSNHSPTVISWTHPSGVRWNACEDINCFLSQFLSLISHVVLRAPFRVSAVVPNSVSKADSFVITVRSSLS